MNDAMIFTYDVHTSVITQYVLPGCAKPGVRAGPGFRPPGFRPPGFGPPGFRPPGFGPPGFRPGFGLGLGVVSGSPHPRK